MTVTLTYLHAAEKAGLLGAKKKKLARVNYHLGVVVVKDGEVVRTKRGNPCLFMTWEAAEAFIESRDDLKPHFDFSETKMEAGAPETQAVLSFIGATGGWL